MGQIDAKWGSVGSLLAAWGLSDQSCRLRSLLEPWHKGGGAHIQASCTVNQKGAARRYSSLFDGQVQPRHGIH